MSWPRPFLRPARLRPGDAIRVVSPSGSVRSHRPDYQVLVRHPKIFLGMNHLTMLLNATSEALTAIVLDVCGGTAFPTVELDCIGYRTTNVTLPIGCRAVVDEHELTVLEEAVS